MTEARSLRIVVGEDDLLVGEGIRQVLHSSDEFEVAALCGDLDSLVEAVEREQPDVVVTDIRMPPTKTDEGLRLAAHLRETAPEIGVVVLTQFLGPTYAIRLLEDGSAGRAYLLKERIAHPIQLFGAIREVAEGGSVVDPKVVETLVEAKVRAANSPLESLTPRELDVLREIAQGKGNAAIAESLFVTKRGVEKHVNAIFGKLDLPEEGAVNRRVLAALLYLAEQHEAEQATPDR